MRILEELNWMRGRGRSFGSGEGGDGGGRTGVAEFPERKDAKMA